MNQIAPFEVPFLCTGNSALSIFGGIIMRKVGKGAFNTQSGEAHPRGEVHPMTLRVSREAYRLDPQAAHAKGISAFLNRRFDSGEPAKFSNQQ